MKEGDLDRLFAKKLDESAEFADWVLSHTKFREFASSAFLLKEEQIAARPNVRAENWFRHWWCRLPDGTESETDIFVVFELRESDRRFSLHIENKPAWGSFTDGQQEGYGIRASFMARKDRYLGYTDFETILIAPQFVWDDDSFTRSSFSAFISYERIADWIEEFGDR